MPEARPIAPDRVAVYIRWSTEEQGEGTTLGVQKETCQHYLLSQGWVFRPDLVFVDEGHSGGSLQRPALTRLRQAVAAGQVDCVVTYKLDRLSRSLVDTVGLVLREWDGRCYYKSAREPIDTTTPTGRMFFYILASYAEWERSLIVDRLFSGKKARARQGKNPGVRPPYGFRTDPETGGFMVEPTEADVVRQVFAAFCRGQGARTIAAQLTAAGVPARGGGPWTQNTVLWMLRNAAYRGALVYGRGPAPHARVEGAYPAIVEAGEWEQVQALLGQRRRRRSRPSPYLLSGVARCRCGAAMAGSRSAPGYAYYVCTRARQSGAPGCGCGTVPAKVVEQAVLDRVLTHYASVQSGTQPWELLIQELADETATLRLQLAAVHRAAAEVDRKIARARADYEAGELPARLYTDHAAANAQRRNELTATADGLVARLGTQATLAERAEEARQHDRGREPTAGSMAHPSAAPPWGVAGAAPSLTTAWTHLSIEEQRQVLRHAIADLMLWRTTATRGRSLPVEVELALTEAAFRPSPCAVDAPTHPGQGRDAEWL